MKKSFFLATAVLSVVLFLSGCSSSKEDKKIVRIADNVHGLITPGVWDGQSISFVGTVYEYLVELDPATGDLKPHLAVDWSSPDGKEWTIRLREGVRFHDGSDLTSEDVRFTIERTQDSSYPHLQQKNFEVVQSIETPDDYTVILNLKESRPTFIYGFTDYNMAILSSDYDYNSLGESGPMGTGAYKLAELRPKESALLVRNEDYWLEGYPKADELRIYFIPDVDASMNMLEGGEVDIAPFATTLHKEHLEKAGFRVVSPFQEYRFVALAADRKPFDDNRVRLAMKYCMDPEALAAACHGSMGEDVFYNESPILNNQPEYHDLPLRGRNIEKAKALLAEAGYPDGVEVELNYASDHPFGNELAQTLKELAAPAGFDLKLKGYTRDIYLSQYWMNSAMQLTGWAGRVDPSMILRLAYRSDGPWNESHMDDPEVDALIDRISGEVDPEKRKADYAKLIERFYEAGTVINVQVPFYVAMRKEVSDYFQPMTYIPQYRNTYIAEP